MDETTTLTTTITLKPRGMWRLDLTFWAIGILVNMLNHCSAYAERTGERMKFKIVKTGDN